MIETNHLINTLFKARVYLKQLFSFWINLENNIVKFKAKTPVGV